MKAYLDIETDRKGNICVIGIFIEHNGFVQLHGEDITTDNLEMIMRKAKTVVTFYGDSFDLPVIKRYFNLDLKVTHHSLDLFKVKKGLGIKINRIFFENDSLEGRKVNINGVAQDREKLLLFRKALEDDILFKYVDLPISNFVKGSNIEFNLNLISI